MLFTGATHMENLEPENSKSNNFDQIILILCYFHRFSLFQVGKNLRIWRPNQIDKLYCILLYSCKSKVENTDLVSRDMYFSWKGRKNFDGGEAGVEKTDTLILLLYHVDENLS